MLAIKKEEYTKTQKLLFFFFFFFFQLWKPIKDQKIELGEKFSQNITAPSILNTFQVKLYWSGELDFYQIWTWFLHFAPLWYARFYNVLRCNTFLNIRFNALFLPTFFLNFSKAYISPVIPHATSIWKVNGIFRTQYCSTYPTLKSGLQWISLVSKVKLFFWSCYKLLDVDNRPYYFLDPKSKYTT